MPGNAPFFRRGASVSCVAHPARIMKFQILDAHRSHFLMAVVGAKRSA
jgi:hypothetical protein